MFFTPMENEKSWENVSGGPCPRCGRPMGTWWEEEGDRYWVAPGQNMGNKSHELGTRVGAECPDCGYIGEEPRWIRCGVCGGWQLEGHPCGRCGEIPDRGRKFRPGDIRVCCCGAGMGRIWQYQSDRSMGRLAGQVVYTGPREAGLWAAHIGDMCPYCGRTVLRTVYSEGM